MLYKFFFLLAFLKMAYCENYSVLSLSSAIMDHCLLVSDEQLAEARCEKGGWAPVDYPTFCELLHQSSSHKMIPGGSGFNVIKGLAHLGKKCAVIGKIGNDQKGEYYLRYMNNLGVDSFLQTEDLPTGQAICYITPDKQRTFRTFIGAAHCVNDFKIDPSLFDEVELFHIEGYQLIDHDLVMNAVINAKEKGVKISMDLANIAIVRENKEFISDLVQNSVDILFCNEMEAGELTDLSASEACSSLAKHCEVVVVTMSEKGSWAQKGEKKVYTPAFSVNAVDTTGAGDYFSGGFLQAYLNGADVQKCAWLGTLLSSYVVQVIGADIPEASWDETIQILQKG